LNADIVICGSVFAGVVIGGNATAMIYAARLPKEKRIGWLSSDTGTRKMVVESIARPNSGGGLKKKTSKKKPWMIRVQHLPHPMLFCPYNS